MNDPIDRLAITDGDFRRATALLIHYVNNDRDGITAVIEEAEAADRMRALVWCLPGVVTGIQAGWTAEAVGPVLHAYAAAFADREHGLDGGRL